MVFTLKIKIFLLRYIGKSNLWESKHVGSSVDLFKYFLSFKYMLTFSSVSIQSINA